MLYSHRAFYHLFIRLVYNRYFHARYRVICSEIPDGSTVTEVCSGDCYLYDKYLRHKAITYVGLDIAPRMLRWAKKRGITTKEFDLWKDVLPASEIIIMQGSLYQFIPHEKMIINKLLSAARKKVIISEPIRNLTSSDSPLINRVIGCLKRLGITEKLYLTQRFNRESLRDLFSSFEAFDRSFIIPGGRDMIGLFRGQFKG
ncbi:MAG: hypothetical protein PHQ96_08365 [Candidatus Omnitrophica bacterium]|nr:hypothetical protein [Candidatus Omnitrophota bacterium]